MFLDIIDIQLLEKLKQNSRVKLTSLASQLNLTPSAVKYRIVRLKEYGIIDRFTIQIDKKKIGYEISAFLIIQAISKIHVQTIINSLKKYPEVSKISVLLGDPDIIVELGVYSINNLINLVKNLSQVEEIQTFKTWLVMDVIQPSNNCVLKLKPGRSIPESALKKIRSNI